MSPIDVSRFTRALRRAQFCTSVAHDTTQGDVYREYLRRLTMDLAELEFYISNGQFTFYTLSLHP
jgi:hypothetical protein